VKKQILAVFLAVAMLFGMIPVTAFAAEEPHNYVGNGSFEDTSALWNYSSVWQNATVVTDDPTGAADGNNYAVMTCDHKSTLLGAVALALVPNATFRFSAQVKGTIEEGSLAVDLRHYTNGGAHIATEVYDLEVASADEWTTVSVDVVLPAEIGTTTGGGTEIRIGFKNGAISKGVIYVDDVRFYEIEATEPDPDPDTTILTAATDPEAVDNKNYLLNEGDFEVANPFNVILSERTEADAYEGSYSMKMSTKSTELKSQFKVIANMLDNPGKLYRLTLMVKGKAEGKLMVAYSNWTNENGLIDVVEKEIGTVDTADWTQLTYTIRLPENVGGTTGGGTEITLHFTGLGTVYVDNVEFYQVAETATEGAGGNANLGTGAEPEAPYVPEPDDSDDGFLSYTRDSVNGKNYLDVGEGDFESFVVSNNLKNAVRQSDVTYRGNYAMKMLVTEDMDDAAQKAQFMVVANKLNPGKTYNLTMIVKGSIEGKLIAAMNNYNNNNGHIGLETYEIGEVNSPDEWTQLVLTVKMPDNVGGTTGGGSEINLYFEGTGELYVDNVEFYEVWASWKYESLDNKNYLDPGEGDFEAGVTGTNLQNAAVQSDVVFEGNNAIKMSAGEGERSQFLVIANKLNPGKIYNLALMVKGSTTGNLMAGLNHWDNNNAFLKSETLDLGAVNSPDNWTQIVYKLKVPDLVGGTTGGGTEINIYFEGEGELYVDDVQFYYVADVIENTNPEVGPADSVDGKDLLEGKGAFETLGDDGMPVGFWFYNDEADMLRGHIPTLNTDEDFVHGGSNSVKLLSEKGGLSGMQSDFFIPAIPGATYTMAYWGKGELGVGEGAARGIIGAGATFYKTNVEFEDEEEEKANIVSGTDPGAAGAIKPNPFGWTYFKWSFTAPDGAAYMKVSIPIPWDSGYVCIDDWVLYCTELPVSEPIDDKQCAINGGFEDVENGVPADLAEPALAGGETESTLNASAEETEKVTGNYALKLATDEAGDARVHIAAKDLVPSATYRVTFKYKGNLSTDLSVDLELYNRNEFIWDTYIKDVDFADVTPTDEWQLYTGFFTVPLNGAAALLELSYTNATGAVYIDDVEIYMVGGPDLATMVPELVYCYPDLESSYTELRFFSGYNAAENYTVNFKLMDGDTVLQSVTDAEIVDHVATFNYDLTAEMKAASKAQWDLWLADHDVRQDYPFTVVAEVLNADGSVRATYTDYIYIYERPTTINEEGQYVDSLTGEVFDIVFAHGIRRFTEFADEAAVKAYLQTMKDAGINTVAWQFNYEEDGGYRRDLEDLQILYEMDMKAIAVCFWGMYPAGNEHNTEQVPARIKQVLANGTPEQLSAIYAWSTADEPFAHEDDSNEVRKDMINGYKMLRALDPNIPVTYVEADYRFYEQAASFADIVHIDPYPGTLDYNTWVADRSTLAREEIHESRNINNIMQAITYATVRPTGQQLHSMIYQAFLADSNYLSYYAMEWTHDIPLWESTDLWPAITAFHTDEDDVINAQYSSGSETFVKRDRSDDAWYDVWTAADGTTYVAVQNRLHETNVVDIELDDVADAAFVTKYNADLAAIEITDSGLNVTLVDGQAVLIKLTIEATDDDDEEDTDKFEPEGRPNKKPFDGVTIIIGAGKDKDNVTTGDSPIRLLAPFAGVAVVAAGALWISRKRSSK